MRICGRALPVWQTLRAVLSTGFVSAVLHATAGAASAPLTLRIVGGLSGLNQYTQFEEPFWTRELPRLSAGRYQADIAPFDRSGVPGPDMLRLLHFGVLPFGNALLSNISTQYPELAAPDLAGLNPDIDSLRKNLATFRPFLEKILRDEHGIELLAVYTYPAQVMHCKTEFKSLRDLAGRQVRVASATQADLVSALGATPLLIRLPEVMASMHNGAIDCAVTGAMSANTIGLYKETHFVSAMPITWGLSFFGANHNAWSALPTDLQELLRRELPKLEAAIWANSERETQEGLACNTGQATCLHGHLGAMRQVPMTAADDAFRRSVFGRTVLQHWIQRSGGDNATLWNQTIGQRSGITAPAPN